jgi:hypothetical protein
MRKLLGLGVFLGLGIFWLLTSENTTAGARPGISALPTIAEAIQGEDKKKKGEEKKKAAEEEEHKAKGPFKNLKYRLIGPAAGGRVSRSCGVPGDPSTYYLAAASGGVWKTVDSGLTWKPMFDDQSASSMGAIALAPSDPNVVYVGSGEANVRGNVEPGNGIYKSTNGGKTWTHVWKQKGQIGR